MATFSISYTCVKYFNDKVFVKTRGKGLAQVFTESNQAFLTLSKWIVPLSGRVTWDEYRVKFLASKGFNEKEVAEKIKNNEDLKVDEESK